MSVSYPLFVNLTGRDPGPNPSIVVRPAWVQAALLPRLHRRHVAYAHMADAEPPMPSSLCPLSFARTATRHLPCSLRPRRPQVSWDLIPCTNLTSGTIKMLLKKGGQAYYQAFGCAPVPALARRRRRWQCAALCLLSAAGTPPSARCCLICIAPLPPHLCSFSNSAVPIVGVAVSRMRLVQRSCHLGIKGPSCLCELHVLQPAIYL